MIGVNERAAHDYIETVTSGIDALTRSNRFISTADSRPLWQRVLAGERLPERLSRHPKCEGTVEDHRAIALDVRELIRKSVFGQRVGSTFRPNLAYPWLRMMRLNANSLCLELNAGRAVTLPLVWANCGVMGARMRLSCPLCARRVCVLYHLDSRLACSRCNSLRYAAQRSSSFGRKALARRKIRRKLGDYGQLWSATYPPKPRGMWRRTYERHCAALARIERKLGYRPLFERVFDGVDAGCPQVSSWSAVPPLTPIPPALVVYPTSKPPPKR